MVEGKVDIEEIMKKEKEEEQIAKAKEELAERAKREQILKGRPGKGHKPGYLLFCARCHTEYMINSITQCTNCGNENLLTYEVSSRIF